MLVWAGTQNKPMILIEIPEMSSEEEWKFYMVESCKIGPIFT